MIAQEFASAPDLMAHYAETRKRLWHVPAKPMRAIPQEPQPLIAAPTAPRREDWRSIAQSIADAHQTTLKAIVGPSRARRLQPARQELYYRMVVERGLSLNEVGHLMNRDHTSILHGLRRHMQRTPEVRGGYEAYRQSQVVERKARDLEVWRRYQDGQSLATISFECRIAPTSIAVVVARVDAEQRSERLKDWAAKQ